MDIFSYLLSQGYLADMAAAAQQSYQEDCARLGIAADTADEQDAYQHLLLVLGERQATADNEARRIEYYIRCAKAAKAAKDTQAKLRLQQA